MTVQYISQRISASHDDAYLEWLAGDFYSEREYLRFGYTGGYNPYHYTVLRFICNIPAGADILTATLTFLADNINTGTVKVNIYGEKVAAPATYSGLAETLGRALTTDYEPWTVAGWTTGATVVSPDFASVIQEIVDACGALTNIAIQIKGSAGSNYYADSVSYDHAVTGPTTCALLDISYVGTPNVTTQAVSAIDKTTATGNGNVTDDGGFDVTERGVCYCLASHGTPDTSDDKDTAAGTVGAFTTSMTGLTPATDYHARAYAINVNGTYYGALVDFTTDIEATYVEILTADLVDDIAGGTASNLYPVSSNVLYDHAIADATASLRGHVTAAQITKLDGIETGATKYPDTGEQAFLDADHSKLDGIEAAADVTDATNVAAAGALMSNSSLIPSADDTYWLGELASPFKSYKGIILKDTTNGKHYKIEVISGVVTATALD